MAVLPAERDLRRVIGDGEGVPDGEVEGLSQDDLLELHRRLVLLRTYDERSVVYHSQGRIGTYAIFWGHEAMQVGGTYALEDTDWIVVAGRGEHLSLMVRDTDVVRGDLVGAPLASRLQLVRTHSSRAAFFVCAAWADGGDEQERVAHVVRAVRRHEAALADAVELRDFARWLSSRVDGAGTDTDEQV